MSKIQNYEVGCHIVDQFDKMISLQTQVSLAFFGGSVVSFVAIASSQNQIEEFKWECVYYISFVIYCLAIVAGFVARMSLTACIPTILNYKWGDSDASKASYGGKSTLETTIVIQLIFVLTASAFAASFIVRNALELI